MLGNILPPYHSLQELNLDWILTKVKDMLRFLPDDGSVGQILRRTAHGAEWSNEQGGGAVNSVNGQTGDVVLTAADVGALADTTPIPDSTSDLVNDSGFVNAAGAAAAAPVQSVNGQTGAVTITAPVTSVNGQTGAVSLTIPTQTGDLINDAGFVDAAGAAAAAPVQSVNGQTGAVTVLPALSSRTSITLPFDATTDGFFEVLIRATAQGRFYANFISNNLLIDAYQAAGGYSTACFPIKAGTTIAVPTLQNVSSTSYYWTAIN